MAMYRYHKNKKAILKRRAKLAVNSIAFPSGGRGTALAVDEVFETNETDSSSVSLRLPPDVCNANSLDNGVILFSPQEKAFLYAESKEKPRARRGEDYLIYSARSYLFRYL